MMMYNAATPWRGSVFEPGERLIVIDAQAQAFVALSSEIVITVPVKALLAKIVLHLADLVKRDGKPLIAVDLARGAVAMFRGSQNSDQS